MALEFAHGAIQWLTSDAALSTKVVSGLGFRPKAIRFYWLGLQSATDAASQTVHQRAGVGFASDVSGSIVERAVATFSDDAAAAALCGAFVVNIGCVLIINTTPVAAGRLNLDSFDADGFTIQVGQQAAQNITVFWEAWGGDDITDVTIGDISEPAATGTQAYTAAGFLGTETDDEVVMLAGVQSTAAVNSGQGTDSGLSIGFAGVDAAGTSWSNICIASNSDDGSSTMDSDRWGGSDACLAQVTIGGGSLSAKAARVDSSAGNFSLNWSARATSGRKSIYMAIKGGKWTVGGYSIDARSIGNTATVSGLSYAPKGVSLIGAEQFDLVGLLNTTQFGELLLGSGTSPTSRRAMSCLEEDATANAEINLVIEYDQILRAAETTGAAGNAYDLDAMNSDGFRIIVDVAGAIATEWQGYLTFGDAPSADPNLIADSGSVAITGTAASLERGLKVAADSGSVAITGTAATLRLSKKLSAESGALVITGAAATLKGTFKIVAEAGSVTITGTTATLSRGRSLAADAGSFLLTGTAATLRHARKLAAGPGNFEITGTAATLRHARKLAADAGSVAITGTAAALAKSRRLAADPGSFDVTGTAATLRAARKISAEAGFFAITGTASVLSKSIRLTAEAGSFNVTGTNAALLAARKVAAEAGSFAITGTAATLARNNQSVEADPGAFTISGTAAALEKAYEVTAGAGSVLITGTAAGLTRGRRLTAESGGFTISGTAATLSQTARRLAAESGLVVITGTSATLIWTGEQPQQPQQPSVSSGGGIRFTRTRRKPGFIGVPDRKPEVPGPNAYSVHADPGHIGVQGSDADLMLTGELPWERTRRRAKLLGRLPNV